MKAENPIEQIWHIREDPAAEERCDVHSVFETLRQEEKKHGDRVRSVRKTPAPDSLALREDPPRTG